MTGSGDGFPIMATSNGARYLPRPPLPVAVRESGRLPRFEETHRDQVLAVFGGLGVPLEQPLKTVKGTQSIKSLLGDCMAEFHARQIEIEWTTQALLAYVPPRKSWSNKFGEVCSFDQLAEALCAREVRGQSCAGLHVFEALVRLESVDAAMSLLSPPARGRVRARVNVMLEALAARQRASGAWGLDWHIPSSNPPQEASRAGDNNRLHGFRSEEVLVTGHVLCALRSCSVTRCHVVLDVRAAAVFLGSQLRIGLTQADVLRQHFCPIVHAVCAIGILGAPQRGA